MAHPTDAEILTCVRQGEHRAFLEIFDRYYDRIERYAACVLQDAGAASAAAAATFVQAYREARRPRGQCPAYPATLFLLCRRQLLRQTGRDLSYNATLSVAAAADAMEPSELEELPLSIILCSERDALIRSALDGLSFSDREIIHLAFEAGLSRAEIGAVLKQPSDGAVTAHLFRALRRLGTAVVQAGYALPQQEGKPHDRVKQWART